MPPDLIVVVLFNTGHFPPGFAAAIDELRGNAEAKKNPRNTTKNILFKIHPASNAEFSHSGYCIEIEPVVMSMAWSRTYPRRLNP